MDTSYRDSWTPGNERVSLLMLFVADETKKGVDWSKYENISIVYTWVNGSEPEYRDLRARVGGSDKGSSC